MSFHTNFPRCGNENLVTHPHLGPDAPRREHEVGPAEALEVEFVRLVKTKDLLLFENSASDFSKSSEFWALLCMAGRLRRWPRRRNWSSVRVVRF